VVSLDDAGEVIVMHPAPWVTLLCGAAILALGYSGLPEVGVMQAGLAALAVGVLVAAPKRAERKVTKTCLHCAARVPRAARVCRSCGYNFEAPEW
jgi:ribosomal protein L40E